jgi:hypothetical protein
MHKCKLNAIACQHSMKEKETLITKISFGMHQEYYLIENKYYETIY